jgi:transposase
LNLAKNVVHVHGVDARGHAVFRKRLPRKQVLPFTAQVPPCRIGLKASGGAHYWARELTKLGHTVKLMSPQFVRPYVQRQKNDASHVAGLCEAVSRPHMRFVPMQSVEH